MFQIGSVERMDGEREGVEGGRRSSLRRLTPGTRGEVEHGASLAAPWQAVYQLVRNSLESGAASVSVRVDLDPSNLRLQVIDDGVGLGREDLEVVGRLHWAGTRGGQGRSLAALRRVARHLAVTSRVDEPEAATSTVTFEEGRRVGLRREPGRTRSGTTVAVAGFLWNRRSRRLLVREEAELSRLRRGLVGLAVARPAARVSLRDDRAGRRRLLLDLGRHATVEGVWREALAEVQEGRLVQSTVCLEGDTISGVLCTSPHGSRRLQFVSVSGWPVERGLLYTTVETVCARACSFQDVRSVTKKFPAFAINISPPQSETAEVELARMVAAAVAKLLEQEGLIPKTENAQALPHCPSLLMTGVKPLPPSQPCSSPRLPLQPCGGPPPSPQPSPFLFSPKMAGARTSRPFYSRRPRKRAAPPCSGPAEDCQSLKAPLPPLASPKHVEPAIPSPRQSMASAPASPRHVAICDQHQEPSPPASACHLPPVASAALLDFPEVNLSYQEIFHTHYMEEETASTEVEVEEVLSTKQAGVPGDGDSPRQSASPPTTCPPNQPSNRSSTSMQPPSTSTSTGLQPFTRRRRPPATSLVDLSAVSFVDQPTTSRVNLPISSLANLPISSLANLPIRSKANLPTSSRTNLPTSSRAGEATFSLQPAGLGSLATTSGAHLASNSVITLGSDFSQEPGSVSGILERWRNPQFSLGRSPLRLARGGALATECRLTREHLQEVTFLNQVEDKFLATVCGGLLVLWDQHAVHERIRVERLLGEAVVEVGGRSVARWGALPQPLAVTLPQAEALVLAGCHQVAAKWGVRVVAELTTPASLSLSHIPHSFLATDISRQTELCRALLLEVAARREEAAGLPELPAVLHHHLASQACRGAVMFGHHLEPEACRSLLEQLAACSAPFQCAHGRPACAPLVRLSVL